MFEVRIDVLTAQGVVVGSGAISHVVTLSDTRALDAVGSLTFSIPANSPQLQLIKSGVRFDVFDEGDGFLGRYIYYKMGISEDRGTALATIDCLAIMDELTQQTVGYKRQYKEIDIKEIIQDLAAVSDTGWTVAMPDGIGISSLEFEGSSILSAILDVASRHGLHVRQSGVGRNVEVGEFGDESGIAILNNRPQDAGLQLNTSVAYALSLRFNEDLTEIVNRVIPFGAGQREAALTIAGSEVGEFPVQQGLNKDGTVYYYIENQASRNTHGLRSRELKVTRNRPLDNSIDSEKQQANELKVIAEAWMKDRLEPRRIYSAEVIGLQQDIQVGQTVHLSYTGTDSDGHDYINVDDELFVLSISRNRSFAGGKTNRSTSLELSKIIAPRTRDSDLIFESIKELRSQQQYIQPTVAYAPVGPYTNRMDSSIGAQFTIRIQDEVMRLIKAVIRFKTSPLKSSVTAAAAGGNHRHKMFDAVGSVGSTHTTPGSNSYGAWNAKDDSAGSTSIGVEMLQLTADPIVDLWTHDNSGEHTHPITYGLFQDTNYPQTISISINGVDETAALDGPWAPSNAGIEQEINITDILNEAEGGFRQNHLVEFTCTTGQGEVEFEADLVVAVQAIV